jgi:hypothetical protein
LTIIKFITILFVIFSFSPTLDLDAQKLTSINNKYVNNQFGWQLQSNKNDIQQTAYQIEIYSHKSADNEKIWDSEKVFSSQSQGIKTNIENVIKPGIKYQWRVRVWDNKDRRSRWSELRSFRLQPYNIDINASWIGAIRREDSNIPEGRTYHGLSINSETGKKWQATNPLSKRSIYLRKEFTNDKIIRDAIIYISGLGHYELTLNGEKLGESQFDPMWSDYDKTIYYNSFNVTDLLEQNNAVGVILGNGFYNQQGGRYVKMQVSFGPPTLFFKMNIIYEDGSMKELVSDDSWKYSLSPIVFNDMYGGEDYDAQLEQDGWDNYGFDDSHWMPVVVQEAPNGKLTPQTTYPIKSMEIFPAKSVKRVSNSYVYDMG